MRAEDEAMQHYNYARPHAVYLFLLQHTMQDLFTVMAIY